MIYWIHSIQGGKLMQESKLHDLIIKNTNIQKDICNILGIKYKGVEFIHEDKYINEITADFTIKKDNMVLGIIECKGSHIGVTDYVRGIGQVLQYGYFIKQQLSDKGYEFDLDAPVVLCFPGGLITRSTFNVGLFKYPENCKIIEVHEKTHAVREITPKMLSELSSLNNSKLVMISQYYVRDNRLYELYILLRHLNILKLRGETCVNRKKLETEFLIKIGTPNNRNWRNAFISLSSFGFIDSNNLPTETGSVYGQKTFEEFVYDMFSFYLKPYFEEIYAVLESYESPCMSINNSKLCEEIRQRHRDRDVLFLTESKGRYISSWMNILRDDFGCISFVSKQSERTIRYNPLILNRDSLIKKIQDNTEATTYINKYLSLI